MTQQNTQDKDLGLSGAIGKLLQIGCLTLLALLALFVIAGGAFLIYQELTRENEVAAPPTQLPPPTITTMPATPSAPVELTQLGSAEDGTLVNWTEEGTTMHVGPFQETVVLYFHSDPGSFWVRNPADENEIIASATTGEAAISIFRLPAGLIVETTTGWCEFQNHQCMWMEVYNDAPDASKQLLDRYLGTTEVPGKDWAPIYALWPGTGPLSYQPSPDFPWRDNNS